MAMEYPVLLLTHDGSVALSCPYIPGKQESGYQSILSSGNVFIINPLSLVDFKY